MLTETKKGGRASEKNMKDELILRYGMKRVDIGKYNEIWENDKWVLIWNRVNGQIKLKPKHYIS